MMMQIPRDVRLIRAAAIIAASAWPAPAFTITLPAKALPLGWMAELVPAAATGPT
ncbi:MAG: hypothetical protein WA840_15330 [Caulobacteraceae bacterium]